MRTLTRGLELMGMMGNDSSLLAFRRPGRLASRALGAVACGLGLLAAGCDAVLPECRSEACEPMPIRILTWWPSAGSAAEQSLKTEVKDDPLITEIDVVKEGPKAKMVSLLAEQMPSAPPLYLPEGQARLNQYDAFLANGGRDVLRWTACRGGGGADELIRLDEQIPDFDWVGSFSPAVRTGLECCPAGGECSTPGIYAVPLGLHRVNHIIYNTARFAQCEDERALVGDVDTFVALLRCLGVDGRPVISMPMNDCEATCEMSRAECAACRDITGQSLLYLLESLFLLQSRDATQYQRYWRGDDWRPAGVGGLSPTDPLPSVLHTLGEQVRPFLNACGPGCTPENPPVDFDIAQGRIANDGAAFMVVPDWFPYATYDGAVDEAAFPGTDQFFLFASDVFAVPANANLEAGSRWVERLLRPDIQGAFSIAKPAEQALGRAREGDVPSLEALLPPTVDIAKLRSQLNDWMRDYVETAPLPMVQALAEGFAQVANERTSSRCNEGACSR